VFTTALNSGAGVTEDIDGDIVGTAIDVSVSLSVEIPSLVPTIVVSPEAAVSPASETPGLFPGPEIGVDFTVTAEDGSFQIYTATIHQEEGENNPPVVSFPAGDFLIAGAELPFDAANGEYFYLSTRKYSNGDFFLYYMSYTPPGEATEYYWVISGTDTITSPYDAAYFFQALRFRYPLAEGWMVGGVTPVPMPELRVYGVPVSSDAQYYSSPPVGATLYGVYLFDDPDIGDTDASTYQWYQVIDPYIPEFGPIPGATGRYYTVTGTEGGEILFEVTAQDSRGAVGNTVLSDRVVVGGG
jgi:hypothetical protein